MKLLYTTSQKDSLYYLLKEQKLEITKSTCFLDAMKAFRGPKRIYSTYISLWQKCANVTLLRALVHGC